MFLIQKVLLKLKHKISWVQNTLNTIAVTSNRYMHEQSKYDNATCSKTNYVLFWRKNLWPVYFLVCKMPFSFISYRPETIQRNTLSFQLGIEQMKSCLQISGIKYFKLNLNKTTGVNSNLIAFNWTLTASARYKYTILITQFWLPKRIKAY